MFVFYYLFVKFVHDWILITYLTHSDISHLSGEFEQALEEKAGKASRKAFEEFKEQILAKGGIAEVSAYIPPFALRSDLGVVASLARYLWKFLLIGTKGLLLTGPFTTLMDKYEVRFARCYLC